MSDFLTLVQDLHAETGAAGVAPTSVIDQTGEAKRLVNWIKRADIKIQTKWINWKFLRAEFLTGNVTTASVVALAKPATLHTWDTTTFRFRFPLETVEHPLPWVEYDKIKTQILDTSTGVPSRVIIMPDNSLEFEPIPDDAYTILADFYSKPIPLAANTDISLIPEEYHDSALLGRAMLYYANFENAPEIRTQGEELYGEGIAEMENHQLPNQNYSRFRTGGFFEVVGGQFGGDEFGDLNILTD